MTDKPETAEPDEDAEDDPRHALDPEKIPALVLIVIALALFGIPVLVMDGGGLAAALPLPLLLNALLLFRGRPGESQRLTKWLCRFAIPGNIALTFMAVVGIFSVADAWGISMGIVLLVIAVTGFWRSWRYLKAARPPKPPRPPMSKLKKRLTAAALVFGALFVALVVALIIDEPCACSKSRYWETASPKEKKALHLAYSSLTTTGRDIKSLIGDDDGGANAGAFDRLEFFYGTPPAKDRSLKDKGIGLLAVTDSFPGAETTFVRPEDLALLTGDKDTRVIFNWRRHIDQASGEKTDAIMAIIPGVKFCDGTMGYKVKPGFKIAKDNHSRIDDSADFDWTQQYHEASCFRTADGKDYYFQVLYDSTSPV